MTHLIPISTLWKTAAVGFGLIIGVAVIALMQFINFRMHPFPENFSASNTAHYYEFIYNNPVLLIGMIICYATGSFFSGAAARFVYTEITSTHAYIIGSVLMLLGFFNLITAPHPTWFWILSVFAYIPFAWLGVKSVYYHQFSTQNRS